MGKTMAIGAVVRRRESTAWTAVHAAASRGGAALLYGMMGLAGGMLWLAMHLPMGERAKETLVYAMAGCVGLFTLGRQMLRAQRSGQV
ncbi:hypothetical protein AAG565_12545 [Fontimonas sp. SYSU GA230001]|uniref:hypothetical protein n=1 Tax=Fontimonas sp. SYSU GA230001 TaxID=3142450 RepID=UPI0032B4D99C